MASRCPDREELITFLPLRSKQRAGGNEGEINEGARSGASQPLQDR